LISSGDTLYGTAGDGGAGGRGTVFAVRTNGTSFTTLHSFSPVNNSTNIDGANPQNGLVLLGNKLYGTATYYGRHRAGTIYCIGTDGADFTSLHNFSYTDGGGSEPYARLVASGDALFGVTLGGGSAGNGTIFRLSLPAIMPNLTINLSGAAIVLSWPTNFAGFTLQSTTNLVAPIVWSTNSPAPTIVNGQNSVTNPISGTQNFYRLSQ
jgi:uncharacterized repeat protein (TIGR03803 family)